MTGEGSFVRERPEVKGHSPNLSSINHEIDYKRIEHDSYRFDEIVLEMVDGGDSALAD